MFILKYAGDVGYKNDLLENGFHIYYIVIYTGYKNLHCYSQARAVPGIWLPGAMGSKMEKIYKNTFGSRGPLLPNVFL